MDRNSHARDGQRRAIAVFEKRPHLAQATNTGTATVKEGLACTYSDGSHSIGIDMPEAIGGTGTAPTPGYFGRAGICGCIAIGIKMTATREGLSLDRIAVSIEQEFDNRGVLGFAEVPAEPSGTRIGIAIASSEPEEHVRDLVERTLAADPWFLCYREAQPVQVDCTTVAGAS